MTDMTAAQAAQQNNRDGGGRYATKVQSESGADLVVTEPPVPFRVNEGACLVEEGRFPVGVRVVADNGGDTVTVRLCDGAEKSVARTQLVSGRLQTTSKPVSEIEQWELVVVDGEIFEVASVDNDHKTTSIDLEGYEGGVGFECGCDEDCECDDEDTSSIVSFSNDDEVQVVDNRYVGANAGLAIDPDAISDNEFEARFTVVPDPDEHDNTCREDVPDGVPEGRVWTQVMGQLDDGREVFQLLPGYHREAINYVVTEKAWDELEGGDQIRVAFD